MVQNIDLAGIRDSMQLDPQTVVADMEPEGTDVHAVLVVAGNVRVLYCAGGRQSRLC